MYPELRAVLPGGWLVVVSTHALAVGVAVAVGIWWSGRRAGAAASVQLVAAWVAAVGLIGSHFWFLLLRGRPLAVTWSGGLASMGGVIGGLAAAWVGARVARLEVGLVLDAIVPAGLLGLGIGRLGCFLAACCYGAPTDVPWAVVFPGAGPAAR
ncbi:MAG: prolipoprotein diacylglyceryl transferase family protein, partial [Planctomycetota bacterium]